MGACEGQITGFQMKGNLLGMDAINTERYQCDALALEDSEVCEIPFQMLETLFAQMPTLRHHFHRTLSQEITNEQKIIMLLGRIPAPGFCCTSGPSAFHFPVSVCPVPYVRARP